MTSVLAKFQQVKALVESVAPESVTNLNDGASRTELDQLRQVVPFGPELLFDLLSLHNGEEMIAWTSVFPDGMQLMAIDHIIENSKYCQERPSDPIDNLEELVEKRVMRRPRGRVKPIFFHSKRVPFAHVNGELIWYFDMDPPDGGKVGQIVYEDAECLTLNVVADSFDDLLDKYIRDLGAGKFRANEGDGQIKSESRAWYADPDRLGDT
jgi:cell wall assembly regulator SMI1